MINLNGSNYQLWKTRMEDLLYVNGFHEPIICSERPQDKTNEEWNLLHRRVCAYIRQWVDDRLLNHVSGEIDAHILWNKLGQMCAQKTCHSKLFLIKQLMDLRYHDGTAMSDHLNTFQGIINRLSETGIKIDEEVQGLWLLGTLPDSWDVLSTPSLNSTPNGIISVELVKNSVLNEEMRRKSQGSTSNTSTVATAHQYTVIKVARDKDLHEQIGKSIFFDLVDHDKLFSFRIQKHIPFAHFKEEVATKFGMPVQYQRFWHWTKRKNLTYRPYKPLTPQEEAQPVGQLCGPEVSNKKAKYAELKLFLEVEIGQDSWPVPPPAKTKNEILLFFKLYDPRKEELHYVGRLWVNSKGRPKEILTKLNELAGFAPGQEIELFEEIQFEPYVMCERVDKELTFRRSMIENGDIICFQKHAQAGTKTYRYPDVPSFLKHVHDLQN
ncbi:putative ubiquitinyl hydrolase 1 [Helianthus annuus]|nr:putative ubiquitinyl hydrolase 1 [Helianthus annuus]KAJ0747256.1 putative ubiquitinyl hydrolase 1 [Helianthus annuus]